MSSFTQQAPGPRPEGMGGGRPRQQQQRKPKPASAEGAPAAQGRVVAVSGGAGGGGGDGAPSNKPKRNRSKRGGGGGGGNGGGAPQAEGNGGGRQQDNRNNENPSKKPNRGPSPAAPAVAAPAPVAFALPVHLQKEHAPVARAAVAVEQSPQEDPVLMAYMTTETFSSLNICAASKRAIAETLKFNFMTHVQATCIGPIMQGKDCLAKSKTGTGKTLAFLIPAVESIQNQPKSHVSILALSPTRELANQIATEAKALLSFHVGSKVVVFVGGTNVNADKKALAGAPVTVLVATPGRLIDHLQSTQGFAQTLGNIKVLIMDEADRLLDMGFKPAIDQILRSLPPKTSRQTLLFSATIPPIVIEIARNALRPGYAMIDTTGLAKDDSGSTHLHVHQEMLVAPFQDFIYAVGAALYEQIANSPEGYKILVFFTTARVTGFMAELFTAAGLNIVEMHSRKSQSYRTNASEKFRKGENILMFSSDVTARGMDYPGVTFVLQVGVTDKEQYIHRLGRTARAGKEGKGMIILSDFEDRHMTRELKDLPLHRVSMDRLRAPYDHCRIQFAEVLQRCFRNGEFVKSAEQAYVAWLGFYNSNLKRVGFDRTMVVTMANRFAREVMLLDQLPMIEKKTVGKMGLKGVPGIRLA
jgi:ATP-dependent RNA helicase MSS116